MQDIDTRELQQTIAREVRAALQGWLEAFNNKDLTSLMGFYDSEIKYAHYGAPLMQGIDEVRSWFGQALSGSGPRQNAAFEEETLFVGSDLTFVAGKFLMSQEQEDGSMKPFDSGRMALLYRRRGDRWLLTYDKDNQPPDCKPEHFTETAS